MLGVAVERQVVGGQRHPLRQHGPQSPGGDGVEGARVAVPEEAVVDQHQVGLELDRGLERLAVGADRGDHRADLGVGAVAVRHLHAVRAVVAVAVGGQQRVEGGHDLAQPGHRRIVPERIVAGLAAGRLPIPP